MQKVVVYTTSVCSYCVRAKNLLRSLQVPFEEVSLDLDAPLRAELSARYHWRTVPMIIAGDRLLGGHDDIVALHRRGELLPLLNGGHPSPGP